MKEVLDLINQMSPYILLGFFLAGCMHAFLPDYIYRRYLGAHSFKSVLHAALLGIPLPLCSCGVIPTAMSLHKEGASKGATISFLICTPQTGVDSIIATYSLMGLPFALIRPVAAFVTSLFGGMLTNKFDNSSIEKQDCPDMKDTKTTMNFMQKMVKALRYAFVDMMQDIGRWLVLGLVIAGIITIFVPDSFFSYFSDKPLLCMLITLILAIPMYLCATGSIPIAVALMLKGLSPGTALVLLMAGPAVNVASILVISKVLGKRSLFVYLFSIISGAIAFGLGIDYLFPHEWFLTPLRHIHHHSHHGVPVINWICTVVLAILLANALYHRYLKKGKSACEGGCSCHVPQSPVIVLQVRGMSCNHCKANIEKALLKVEGIEAAEADLSTGKVAVVGHFDMDTVKKVIQDIGFIMDENM